MVAMVASSNLTSRRSPGIGPLALDLVLQSIPGVLENTWVIVGRRFVVVLVEDRGVLDGFIVFVLVVAWMSQQKFDWS